MWLWIILAILAFFGVQGLLILCGKHQFTLVFWVIGIFYYWRWRRDPEQYFRDIAEEFDR